MERYVVEEATTASPTDQQRPSSEKSFIQRNKRLLVVILVIVILLIVIGVTLALVLTLPKKHKSTLPPTTTTTTTTRTTTTTTTIQIKIPNSRIDCVPWLKNKPGVDVESECRQIPGCDYQSLDGNIEIPSCYYNASALTFTNLGREETNFGESYTISPNGKADEDLLKIEFMFLEDDVLRFKVFKGFLNIKKYSIEII